MKWTHAALVVAILACGCGRNIENKDAVRQGVIDYLAQRKGSTGLDMGRMNIEVSNVTFQKDEALATVSFNAKDSKVGGMSMNYVLERKGNKWVVKGRKESGANPHRASGMPGGMGQGMPGAMPPGHPAVGATPPGNK